MNTTKSTILVLTASGSTGMQVATQLLEQGFSVRAFVHRADARSKKLESLGASVVVGSLADIHDMRVAMKGCQRAYFCAPISNAYLRIATVFATVAREQRLEVVVAMSQWLSSPSHPTLQTRECWLADQVLSMLPETDVITVNPGFFADNEMQAIDMAAMFGVLPMPYGSGLNAAPSNEDMARVVTALLAKPEGHAGKTYRITGPKLLSPTEIADIVGKVLGRKVRYVHAPAWMIAKVLPGYGYDAYVVANFLEYAKEYQRGTFAIGGPTDAVLQITGRPAEDYETTVRRYAEALPKNIRSFPSILRAMMKMNWWMLKSAPKTEPELALSDFAEPSRATLSIDSPEWRASHGDNSPSLLPADSGKIGIAIPAGAVS